MNPMKNLENLATAIGRDIKGIKEDSAVKNSEIKQRLSTLENKRDNDNQTLSLRGNTLSLSNGGTVELPFPDIPVYRVAKVDIPGSGIGTTARITTDNLMNPDGVKVGDIVQDFFSSNFGADEGYWKVTSVVNKNITVTWIGARVLPTLYNDSDLQRRVSALEKRPSFDTLTPTQRNILKGENGHSLSVNARIEGSYRNGATSQLNLIADVYYDGTRLTSGYTVDYYYRGFGNNNWQSLLSQTADANGKFGQWNASQRSGGWFEVYIVVTYNGIKAAASTRLDNVSDGARGAAGERGPAGPRGADGAPGQNIINQNGGQPMKYWAGTMAQYNAISNKDPNTIYDVYEQ